MGIKLTQQEQEKLEIINKTLRGELSNGQAARMLNVSPRQVKRLKKKVREEGQDGVVHRLKRKTSNHHIDYMIKEKALAVITKHYADFRPTFATEKLQEHHSIVISPETTRLWMIEGKLWKVRKQKQPVYRSWRPRKEYLGELEQFDGSYHYWFEDRFVDAYDNPIEVCLLASIDDATGKITKAMFAENEGVHAVFTFWMEYVQERGKPFAIYLDAFSTYKINHKAALDNKELMTQFQRAMQSLSIRLITAHSAEAKGRIERLFQTLQDRLIKEMRLANINTPEEGNSFLSEVFLPKFNKQFAVRAAREGNVHKVLLQFENEQLSHIFSIQETRRVNLDFTIQFKNNWYQLTEIQPTTVRPLEKVIMETWLDLSVHIILKGHELTYLLLPGRPKKQRMKQPIILTTHTLNYKPPPDHPWKKRILPIRG
ncbi:MAG: ISNCY family transposase [Candidatus Levybacteria bacterium]|nr:ISNCY family transposase [Candidatus Levybacteria bacterium]